VTDEDKQRYKDRSPINFVDKLDVALALFQGDEDEVGGLGGSILLLASCLFNQVFNENPGY